MQFLWFAVRLQRLMLVCGAQSLLLVRIMGRVEIGSAFRESAANLILAAYRDNCSLHLRACLHPARQRGRRGLLAALPTLLHHRHRWLRHERLQQYHLGKHSFPILTAKTYFLTPCVGSRPLVVRGPHPRRSEHAHCYLRYIVTSVHLRQILLFYLHHAGVTARRAASTGGVYTHLIPIVHIQPFTFATSSGHHSPKFTHILCKSITLTTPLQASTCIVSGFSASSSAPLGNKKLYSFTLSGSHPSTKSTTCTTSSGARRTSIRAKAAEQCIVSWYSVSRSALGSSFESSES